MFANINGVLIPGGNVEIYNDKTKKTHAYYTTASRVIDYAGKVKNFPVFGLGNGVEVIARKFGAKPENIAIYGARTVDWIIEKKWSRIDGAIKVLCKKNGMPSPNNSEWE